MSFVKGNQIENDNLQHPDSQQDISPACIIHHAPDWLACGGETP